MKKIIYLGLLIGFGLCFSGCGPMPQGQRSKVVAQINDYQMTVDDVKDIFHSVILYEDDKVNLEVKKMIIQDMIRKELLLQEAQRLNLDKNKEFMKTIERYWEQALIKSLLDEKTREIAGSVKVTENEVIDYYNSLAEGNPEAEEISEMRAEIILEIKNRKEAELIEAWINGLENNASITVNEEVLEKIDLSK